MGQQVKGCRTRWFVTDTKFGRPIGRSDGSETKREARQAFPSYSRYHIDERAVDRERES